jgi:tRNA A-37 threonylcarbamoyl transferase component Bud32
MNRSIVCKNSASQRISLIEPAFGLRQEVPHMADQKLPSDPHALCAMLSGEITLADAAELAERLDSDPAARSAVDDLLGHDTLAAALNSTVSGEMRQLTAPLAGVMSSLKQSRLATTVAPSTMGERDRRAAAAPLPFLSPAQGPDELGRLDGYRILRVLGEGGMGMVFDAEDIKLKRHVALKVMRPEIAAKAENRQRFLREAQAAATVEHDHIVPIFQVGEDNGVPFIAMPFLKGESLADRLRKDKRPPLREVLRAGREIALGLAAAHRAGLIHRDIKPANVWLEEGSDRVKILDFGLARISGTDSALTLEGAIIGTPAYMSPEQVGRREIDQRVDLFSLGCVLYEMTTGRRAFDGPDTMAILCSLAVETPPTPQSLDPQVPPALSALIMKLLEKDPADRPPAAQAVADELAALQARPDGDGSASLSRTEAISQAPAARLYARRRFRRPLWIAAAALLLVLVGGGWFFGTAVIRFVANQGELVVEVNDPDVVVTVRQNDILVERKDGNSWIVSAGRGAVEVTDRKTGDTLVSREFLVKRNGKEQLRISHRELADARAAKATAPGPIYLDVGNLVSVQKHIGETLSMRVTGTVTGSVWGTDVYSTDSTLAVAAVHAGLLRPGETGVVQVEIVAPPEAFVGSIRYGVTTYSYGSYPAAFRFPAANPGPGVVTGSVEDPSALARHPAPVGTKRTYTVTGRIITGGVWGTDIYTQDSDLATAAVHAGLLKNGETGQVEIEFVAKPDSFIASIRNGVQAVAWNKEWSGGAFRFPAASPADMATLLPEIGQRHTFIVTGSRAGTVWGSDVYTADSGIGTAAVHAGVLKDGQTAKVEIEFVAPPASYEGSTRNDVTTFAYGSYPKAFRFTSTKPATVTVHDAAQLMILRARVGDKHTFNVTGNLTGIVWGNDVYTQDSDLGAAAVHAGLLKDGETGQVEIEFVEKPKTFAGMARNGVLTSPWSSPFAGGAFRFSAVSPANLIDYAFQPGKKLSVRVTGAVSAWVWGTDVYTLDSSLGAAAVHAGILKPGETKMLEVETLVSPPQFTGSTRNGVTSAPWERYGPGAYRFVRETEK